MSINSDLRPSTPPTVLDTDPSPKSREDIVTSPLLHALKRSNSRSINSKKPIATLEEIPSPNTKKIVTGVKRVKTTSLDADFVCARDNLKFEKQFRLELVRLQQSRLQLDYQAFARGEPAKRHQRILTNAAKRMKILAHCMAATDACYSTDPKGALTRAYKQCIGFLDRFDTELKSKPWKERSKEENQITTFPLRFACLIASAEEGTPLETWTAFTKAGKPKFKDRWTFVETWQNWVPEMQGVVAKFCETAIIRSLALSQTESTPRVIAAKGGFGAGKTSYLRRTLARGNFPGLSGAILSPDASKKPIRRMDPRITPNAMHTQSSQIADSLLKELTQKIEGSVVYDSSLSYPDDIRDKLTLSQAAGKQLVVYDIARADMARVLSVLARDVSGEDPRVPPERIIAAAANDRTKRAECMNVILTCTSGAHEYHLFCSSSGGAGSEEVLTLKPNGVVTSSLRQDELREKLASEGLVLKEVGGRKLLASTPDNTEEAVTARLKTEFNKTVAEVLDGLDSSLQPGLNAIFSGRTLNLDYTQHITTAEQFYDALPQNVKRVLSKAVILEEFSLCTTATKEAFFARVNENPTLSYLDLPFHMALGIHAALQGNPW